MTPHGWIKKCSMKLCLLAWRFCRTHFDVTCHGARREAQQHVDDVGDVFRLDFPIRATRESAEFRGDAEITTWLYRITVRVAERMRQHPLSE